MKIKNIIIKNFRSLKHCVVPLDSYTALVGPNGSGKSTILCALNIFFRDSASSPLNSTDLCEDDFYNKNTSDPIEITVTFCDLSSAAKDDFSDYVRHDQLSIVAKAAFDPSTRRAPVLQYGQRLAMEEFAPFFKSYNDGSSASDLQVLYKTICAVVPDFPPTTGRLTKEIMKDSLRSFESANPDRCVLIPSEDRFYGFSRGGDRLSKYIQWIYVPAVKDVSSENEESRNNALGKILARAIRARVDFKPELEKLRSDTAARYKQLVGDQQGILRSLSDSINERLQRWAHPNVSAKLEWTDDAPGSVKIEEPVARILAGEGGFQGDIARFGNGLQRSYLLALLQELAASDTDAAPTLVLGCEEPELYQHPPQARHLAGVLHELSEHNAQIVVTTHSPYFVNGAMFHHIRLIRRGGVCFGDRVKFASMDDIAKDIADVTGDTINSEAAQMARLLQSLQININEMFFSSKVVLVEGLEDLAYITTWMTITGRAQRLRRTGCHIVVANGKDRLIEPAIIARRLLIPFYVVFDADKTASKRNLSAHQRDNRALLKICGGDETKPFPDEAVWGTTFVQWPEDIREAVLADVPREKWDVTYGAATKCLGNPEGSYKKNILHIGHQLVGLYNCGIAPACLEKLCDSIIAFAET